jgi:biopolymer transport protein ExbB
MKLAFDTAYFHTVCIYVLYGMGVLLAFVIVERLVYYMLLNWRSGSLVKVITSANTAGADKILARRDLLSSALSKYLDAARNPASSRTWLEDLSTSLYIKVSSAISARLWILDTIVTAAPLLGLFGTILGIMDTFHALSGGGISDPAAVSRGIADALLATAIGIGVALFGLLGHNILHRYADHLTEEFKRLILASHGFIGDLSANETKASTNVQTRTMGDIGQQFATQPAQ